MKINLILPFLIFGCFFVSGRVIINYGTYKEMLRMYREDRIFFDKALQYGLISDNDDEDNNDEDNNDEDNDNEDTLLNPKEESEWSISDWERYLKYLKRLVDESKKAYYFWLIILIPLLAILFYILIPLWSQGE